MFYNCNTPKKKFVSNLDTILDGTIGHKTFESFLLLYIREEI